MTEKLIFPQQMFSQCSVNVQSMFSQCSVNDFEPTVNVFEPTVNVFENKVNEYPQESTVPTKYHTTNISYCRVFRA